MAWLNYHHLMYFKTIAQTGSIAKASTKLLIGQPALSAQLKTLEDQLGCALFERRNRGLFLTDAGKITLKYANQIFNLGTELQTILKDQIFSASPTIKIGALDSIPKSLILNLVNFIRKKTKVKIRLLEGNVDELLREMASMQIDMIISNYSGMSDNKNIFSKSLGKTSVSVYGSKKFLFLKKNFPDSLNSQPMILPTSHSKLRHDIDHYLHLNNIHPQIVAETQDTSVQKSMGVEELGLLPLPDFSVRALVKNKHLHKIGMLKDVTEEYWLISQQREIDNPIISSIIDSYNFSAV
ncbi:MAG: LysR family transcriptional regulator [Bdellovibrionales bacterium]|nr:LysR family transcriptional regulator [Bdellovibrionales bacterium]